STRPGGVRTRWGESESTTWWDQESSFSESFVSHRMVAAWDYCDGEKSYVELDGEIVQGNFFEGSEF
ncbi:MAG: hypothetical protein J1E42_08355, partial [Akkermansiaceae bacterium]|nr:hypothetical protein [Akkermansiaceae bacterium]